MGVHGQLAFYSYLSFKDPESGLQDWFNNIEYLESGLTASLIKLSLKFETNDKIAPLRVHNTPLETLASIDIQIGSAGDELLNL